DGGSDSVQGLGLLPDGLSLGLLQEERRGREEARRKQGRWRQERQEREEGGQAGQDRQARRRLRQWMRVRPLRRGMMVRRSGQVAEWPRGKVIGPAAATVASAAACVRLHHFATLPLCHFATPLARVLKFDCRAEQ